MEKDENEREGEESEYAPPARPFAFSVDQLTDTMLRFLEMDLSTAVESGDDDGSIELHSLLIFGLCKWLMADRIAPLAAQRVLTRLLVVFGLPATQQCPSIKQTLTAFFPTFVAADAMLRSDAHLQVSDP